VSRRREHYKARIDATAGRRKLNEVVDYLRAATRPDRIDEVADELMKIADREDARSSRGVS
jgi:hypothetical protein